MEVNFKKTTKKATLPFYSKLGDTGLDLIATSVRYDEEGDYIEYDTGIAVEIPKGYTGLLMPRSSNTKKPLILGNSVGNIDQNYRGTLRFRYKILAEYWETCNDAENFQDCLEKGEFHFFEQASDRFHEIFTNIEIYSVGDKVGQLIIIPAPTIEVIEKVSLSKTVRGILGFGSSGK